MSKSGNSKTRRRIRARVRTAIEPFQIEYVLDEIARVLGVAGDGRISLIVRDGYVVGREITQLPLDDHEARRILGIRSANPLMARIFKPDGSLNTPKKPLQ